MPTFRYGQYRGCELSDSVVPTSYLEFLLVQAEQTIVDVRGELDRRAAVGQAEATWADRVITAGLKQLAREYHPDVTGGNGHAMRAINDAVELLREAVREKS